MGGQSPVPSLSTCLHTTLGFDKAQKAHTLSCAFAIFWCFFLRAASVGVSVHCPPPPLLLLLAPPTLHPFALFSYLFVYCWQVGELWLCLG
jgi:hypothetical protein